MSWTVAVGVDGHERWQAAVALDRLGRELGRVELEASSLGYLKLLEWARRFGEPAFAVEGTGS